jgi:hypothetical protein
MNEVFKITKHVKKVKTKAIVNTRRIVFSPHVPVLLVDNVLLALLRSEIPQWHRPNPQQPRVMVHSSYLYLASAFITLATTSHGAGN